ncbi:T9SS type A sorting domain-containing protein [Fluviicola chungangensis]|uniref:T9SS type A sorting domain-containing protein n=1 Tax=Fluviicola chungangensis TaxID=2597671 RepID=A0A556MQV0_9FLAO|nr:T9SS type A sorting domain-containing protein [Fluviicola chungangensis]TSJ42297.1 T9SS type A sorting domain-containing protein [Fluviicola chungangensis]
MKFCLTTFTFFLLAGIGHAQLSGTYTIGGSSPSYSTITAAVNALNAQGVSGPVTFNIRDGIYAEHVIIDQIAGASQTNRIIFQSESLDSSLVRWEFNNTILADNYVCRLNGADFITIRHLTLARDLSSSQGCRTVIFENGAHNNRVEHCRLIGRISSSEEYNVIHSPNTIDTANYIGYNKIQGGYTNIGLTGLNSTALEGGTVIEYNQGSGSLYSMKFRYSSQFRVLNNTFVGSMDIEYFDGKSRFVNNNVSNGGVDIINQLTSTDSLIVFGNMLTGTATSNALYVFNCPNVYVFHNTLVSGLSSSGVGGVFYAKNCNLSYANNIAQSTSTGYAAYFENGNVTADYNIYYSTSTTRLIWRTISYTDLAHWQTMTPYDDHSFQSITNFIGAGTGNLHIFADIEASNNALDLNIGKDLDGNNRFATPDIGADEFDNPDNEAGVVKLMNIPTQICSATVPLVAAVRNYGEIPMTSVAVNWSVNGVTQPVVNWTGSVLPGDSAFVTLSNFFFAPSSTYNFVASTTMPNGQVDAVPSNDSYTNTPVYTMMQGSYTVGGVNPDYPTINSCVSALIQRGVCGPVVFNIRAGIYNEFLDFDGNAMNGLSSTNTVTFQSETLDSTSVEMNYTNTSNSPLWMIDTWRAKHLVFRYMTFSRTSYSGWTNPYNSMYFDMADHITIENCVFRSPVNLLGKGVTFERSSNIKIHNCVFKSMYSCIDIEGDPYSTNTNENVSVQNNRFFNFRERALKVYSIQDSVEIKNNYFTNDTIVLSDGLTIGTNALVATLCGGVVEIMNNRIEGRYGEEAMHVSCMNGTPAYRVKVYNNFISVGCGYGIGTGGGGQGTIALETYTNNYVDFQYNTIHIYSVPWALDDKYCRAAVEIRPFSPSHNIRFKNNIIQADTLEAFFYFPSDWNTTVFSEFDNNNYYRTGQYNIPMSTAPGWPGNWNTNSVSINPLFYSKRDLHVLNPQLAMGIAIASPSVPTDIDGELRAHPTVGADEGNFDPINIGSIQTKVESDCDSARVFARVFNYCLDTINSFELNFTVDGVLSGQTAEWNGTLYPGDTVDWIQIGAFEQTNGQTYLVKTHTLLPNLVTDQLFANDSSGFIYTSNFQNMSIDLGEDLVACAHDTVTLTPQNGPFSNITWSTLEIGQSIEVTSGGTYFVTGTYSSGCVSSDTIEVEFSTPVPVFLTQSEFILTASTSLETTAWYFNNTLIPGEMDTVLNWTNLGSYYAVLTDSSGCSSYSDTLEVENFRDAGILEVHYNHICDSTFIIVDVKNFGTQPILSLEFELIVDGTILSVPNWTGIIASGDTLEDLAIAGIPHVFGQLYIVSARTELPNSGLDSYQPNDGVSSSYQLQQSVFDLGPDTHICKGGSLELYLTDSTNFSDFSWSTGSTNASITIVADGTYTLEALDNFGCERTDEIEVVTAGDIDPTISFSNNTLYSSMNSGNQWYLDGILISNAVGNSFVPTQNGNYTVEYTDQYGCVASSAVYELTNLGIEENDQLFEIYPNPVADVLYVVSKSSEPAEFVIIDVSGKEIQKGQITSQTQVVLLKELEAGTYYIRLSNSNTTHRFIKSGLKY